MYPALFCVCVVVIPRCESRDNFYTLIQSYHHSMLYSKHLPYNHSVYYSILYISTIKYLSIRFQAQCCCPTQVVFILNTIGAEGQMHYKILIGEE